MEYLTQSESAAIFWESIGPKGRKMYLKSVGEDEIYIDYNWEKMPDLVRGRIGKEMNTHYRPTAINTVRGPTYKSEDVEKILPALVAGIGIAARGALTVARGVGTAARVAGAASRGGTNTDDEDEDSEKADKKGKKGQSSYSSSSAGSPTASQTGPLVKSIGSDLSAIIFGLVAGAGGVATIGFLKNKLSGLGIKPEAIQAGLAATVGSMLVLEGMKRMLIRKDNNITFISTDIINDSSMLSGTSFEGYMTLQKEQYHIGETVLYNGKSATIVSISGNYAKVTGEDNPIHLKALMREDDIFYTKSRGMTIWNNLYIDERQQVLKIANMPDNLASRHWRELPEVTRNLILATHNKVKQGDFECPLCKDTFSDKKEYEDHKRAHK